MIARSDIKELYIMEFRVYIYLFIYAFESISYTLSYVKEKIK